MLYSWVGIWMTCRWLLDALAAFSRVETCSQTEHLGERWKLLLGKWAHRPFLPSAQFLRKCARVALELQQANSLKWSGEDGQRWIAQRVRKGSAPCSSSYFGLNQKRWTSACLVTGSKCICWSHSVGKQLKQPVAPGSFKQKSKYHLSQSNSNILNLVASAKVAMCEFPWTLANLWDLLINEKIRSQALKPLLTYALVSVCQQEAQGWVQDVYCF